MKKSDLKGFSLIELMIVVAIIAFLAMIAIPSFMGYLSKAHRTEAYVTLRSLYLAQKMYASEHQGKTTKNLQGNDSLNWKPSGDLKYTYGFPGAEGVNFFTGSLKAPGSALSAASANGEKFTIAAAGDIDGDGKLDILTIDQDGKIAVVSDDLV